MEKKNLSNEQEIKKQTLEARKKRNSTKSVPMNQKRLPWWVELLFVQIGFPDKWLIKILKTKKKAIDIYKDEKKVIFLTFLFLFVIAYFQPVVKYSRAKLKCQNEASKYLYEKTNLDKKNLKKIEMLTVNFCNGGNEIENFYIK
tara:strand:- start:506 stop:937 length:432 start_codon:yes stop_codon:yes gene_type:complete